MANRNNSVPPQQYPNADDLLNLCKPDKKYNYLHFYNPEIPIAWGNGMVALHRYIMSIKIQRWVSPDEMVHFIDGNRTNCSPDNLEILDRAGLGRLRGEGKIEIVCPVCEHTFETNKARVNLRATCSIPCREIYSRKVRHPSPEELADLVDRFSMSQIAEFFCVTEASIRAWCKKYKVQTKPVGFWAKVYAGIIPHPCPDEDFSIGVLYTA